MIGYVLGRILLTEAVLMLFPLLAAIWYGESVMPFIIPILVLALVGLALDIRKPKRTSLYAKEGFVVVALAWKKAPLLVCVVGAIFADMVLYLMF